MPEILQKSGLKLNKRVLEVAEPTGLEPATSNVTGWRSNQLNYGSAGGHRRTRTSNFFLVKEAVYQLTYMPTFQIYSTARIKNSFLSELCQESKGLFQKTNYLCILQTSPKTWTLF
jgi:hypothetical protein